MHQCEAYAIPAVQARNGYHQPSKGISPLATKSWHTIALPNITKMSLLLQPFFQLAVSIHISR